MSLPKSILNHQIFKNKKTPNAPWIVLLHGIGGNSKIWYKQIKHFKKGFHVMTIDLPGHYPNPEMKEWDVGYSFDLCSDMILRIMDEYEIKKAHFIGISLGSVLIHHFAKMYPERMYSAVLGGMIMQFNTLSKTLLAAGHMVKKFVPYMWLYQLFAHIMMPKNNHKQSRTMFIVEARKMRQDEFFRWFELTKYVKSISRNIEKCKVPRLYISGSEDHLFIKLLKKHVPTDQYSQLVELINCGHVCNLEKSAEFNDSAISFLEQHKYVHEKDSQGA
ncbi:alpha/beta fold hydrolase [Salipaludibacillus daqingensis]|uniref:alpha/beta fold hydrolase n=1 Tax=Salipaludibacillus daqingensis TaxID=3041001 RepID=UPI002473D937|nr:alpha/beta fold hydrolase [Salipaludibacillus daqingensis]